ncbi:hypothetical protein CC85DRAFT_284015 [Cutaneotrichosporon oleaginosum]|uniref:Uncharacterized protein n=1 Tax=Cutaneotrichosporon oleaginosum TaxID=879819 RepID=A0A0J1B877_9TREE|nr:uncharacterized protein CC85DRAFT_284015 [Cutaneotrichosporon oleaginosum]KLT43974.1 hypothetical protein CC85DRAFT_284015 [Cutaneotrichosporon oleaginosum]TXT04078.1 hypothetical protein COLE_07775 [Cutaneotrichosporon oleaginosum]
MCFHRSRLAFPPPHSSIFPPRSSLPRNSLPTALPQTTYMSPTQIHGDSGSDIDPLRGRDIPHSGCSRSP